MKKFEQEILAEMSDGVIDGVTVCAGNRHGAVFCQSYGFADKRNQIPATNEMIVDVASITKVVAVSPALAICRRRGLIDFDAPFTDYIEFHAPLPASVTIRDLATHVSGFAIDGGPLPYFSENGAEIMANIFEHSPIWAPRSRYEYACWNFLILGKIVEKITGERLQDFCRREVFEPLGMSSTSLGNPVTADVSRLARTFGTPEAGMISDPVAFRVYRDGCAAGSAGMFSSAPDLARFCRMLLSGGDPILTARDIADFSTNTIPPELGIERGFGYITHDKFKPGNWSEHTIYHSGWSGQTMMIDLAADFFGIVLTSRHGDYDRAKVGRFAMLAALREEFR